MLSLSTLALPMSRGALGTVAKAKAKRAAQVKQSNQRRDARFCAVRQLNALVAEISLPGRRAKASAARNVDVECLVKLLETRLTTPGALQRLHDAAKMWVESGGSFSSPVLEVDYETPPNVGRRRVLAPTFRLRPKAFMPTHNGASTTATSFDTPRPFALGVKTRFGARAWAACLEQSLHADTQDRHRLHAYLLWTDGIGINIESLAPLCFQGIRPRVDVCTAQVPTTSHHTAACHGMWYASTFKDGALKSDTHCPAWQFYKPKARLLESLFEDGKIRCDEYTKSSAAHFPVGHSSRKRDAEEAAVSYTHLTLPTILRV